LNIPEVCSNCHSNAGKMAKYNIPTNQYSQFVSSVHGVALLKKQDLNAPSCNSCHGNHGAVPPGIESISNVCGTCHNLNADLFSKSPHKVAFDKQNLPECETCHGNHGIYPATDNMLGVGNNATCAKCHKNTPSDKGYFVAMKMRKMLDSLKSEQNYAQLALNEANRLGMDVSDAAFTIKDVKQALIETRTIVHLADFKQFDENIQTGFNITTKAKTAGRAAIDDYYFRRKGLGIVTIIVTILAVALYLTIRKIEKKDKKDKSVVS
jgi:predicted CXXCH cytochrome family protein